MTPARFRRRAFAVGLLVLAVAVIVVLRRPGPPVAVAGCSARGDAGLYTLDLSQAANAATISAVASRRGLGDHAVTVALATALQESKLHNLGYGDLDSVGLFQQRPSQGWGPREQLLDPHYAAAAFYAHLAQVPGWQTLPVADAAQEVQHSASGAAYADWEPEARTLARALTGEVAHGLTCSFARPASSPAGLAPALVRDNGPASVGPPVPSKTGWMAATWLVAEAAQYSIETVSFDGSRWTRATGSWQPGRDRTAVVRYTVARGHSG